MVAPVKFGGMYAVKGQYYKFGENMMAPWENRDYLRGPQQQIEEAAKQRNLKVITRIDEHVVEREGVYQGVIVYTAEDAVKQEADLKEAQGFVDLFFGRPGVKNPLMKLFYRVTGFIRMIPNLGKLAEMDERFRPIGEARGKALQEAWLTPDNMQDDQGQLTFDVETGEKLDQQG